MIEKILELEDKDVNPSDLHFVGYTHIETIDGRERHSLMYDTYSGKNYIHVRNVYIPQARYQIWKEVSRIRGQNV